MNKALYSAIASILESTWAFCQLQVAVTRVSGAAILAVLCFLAAPPGAAAAEDAAESDLVLILDASNSMWGQIDGVNKIVIAREAVGELIDGLPDTANVGLIAYGHRRKSDCEDIEVLAQIGNVDKAALKATINSINPKGKTPITASINAAIELARERESTAIVLISDGLETCGLDPCQSVRAAKAEGLPFVLHVVGFDIAKENTAELECAAQAGGGLYLGAEDAPQLSAALQAAYEKPTVPDGRLIVTATAEGSLQDAAVVVLDPATGKQVAGGRTYVSSETNPRRIPLEDGQYQAEVAALGIKGSPKYTFEFEIVDGSTVEKSFDYSAGEISIKVTRNGELSDATVILRAKDSRQSVASGRTYRSASNNPKTLRVVAGTYDVTIKALKMRNAAETVIEDVAVIGGERTELSHDFTSGTLSIGTQRSGALVDATVNVFDSSGRNIGGGRTYSSASSNPKSFVVAPGSYTVRIAEIRGDKREVPAVVAAGDITEIIVDLDQP